MSKGRVDIFTLVIIYLDESYIPQHAIVGLLEVQETSGSAMAL